MSARKLNFESLESRRLLAAVSHRPIEEFIEAQGQFCLVDPVGGECPEEGQFVPPIDNFLGWVDPADITGVSMDYAGLADEWITEESGGAISFETEFSGQVKERVLKDGNTQIDVVLHTKNALTWAFQSESLDTIDFANDPLIFGHRAPEVLNGATPALGDLTFKVTILTDQPPGSDLPDLLNIFFLAPEGTSISRVSFVGHATGPLQEEFGVEDGATGRLQVTQIGLLDLAGGNGAVADGFPVENIVIRQIGTPLAADGDGVSGDVALPDVVSKLTAAGNAPQWATRVDDVIKQRGIAGEDEETGSEDLTFTIEASLI
jgi:hypothetical protein